MGGTYLASAATDRASVVTTSRLPGQFLVGDADIFGSVGTGPGGTVTISSSGNVGNAAFNNNPAYDGQIQTGHSRNDVNLYIPDGLLPIPYGPILPMGPGFVGPGATNFNYVIGNGDYRIASLTLNSGQKMAVVGKARLHVLGQTKTTAGSIIYIAPGASLELYAGGDCDLAGQGIWNYPGRAINLSIIGLNTCTGVSYTGGSKFCGTINAPYAAVKLAGNSESFGAFIGKSFQIVGTMDLHYDESLQGDPHEGRFIIASWKEL